MTNVNDLTADYDQWLAGQIPVVTADVERKHAEMRADRFRFLRGSYYLWLARVVERALDVLGSATVPLVGDLHVENFGTWRDASQTRRWGVNDLDELATGPWLLDLVRLAASARIAPHIALGDKAITETLLSAYVEAKPGVAIELGGKRADHLGDLVPEFAGAKKFYKELQKGKPVTDVPPEVVAAATAVAEPGWKPEWFEHDAGTGSLGHVRRVGVGPAADGTVHAREAKQIGPGTAAWAHHLDARLPTPDPALFAKVTASLKGPAAAARVADWHIRDLAPDVVRIELSGLRKSDARALLTSMAQAAADVHGADASAYDRARKEAAELDPKDFEGYVDTMAACVEEDFAAYS
ncbi:DUF2252 family protein [Nocardioides montaniterrae]